MRNIVKNPNSPKCLEKEKNKADGNYGCGNVYDLLNKDFKNKCYLCESEVLIPEIEHFIPNSVDNGKYKFDWNNLFFACSHCNGIKSDNYNTNKSNQILNCTNINHNVFGWIKYEITNPIKKEIKITPLNNDIKTKNTAELLNKIYNVDSKGRRKTVAIKIHKKIIKEILKLQLIFKNITTIPEDEDMLEDIKRRLRKSSPYSAFKIWEIIDTYGKEYLANFIDKEEFEKYIVTIENKYLKTTNNARKNIRRKNFKC